MAGRSAMVNENGTNQYGVKNYPCDADLLKAFTQYGRENSGAGLEWSDQLLRLQQDFGLTIGRKKLYELRKKVNVGSVRKNKKSMSAVEKVQAVVDMKESDVLGNWGVTSTKQRLANEGILIPRDELRMILHDEYDEEFERRFVGKKRAHVPRTPLNALGSWHQEHSDGHEKMAEQGLNIGKGIHLPIYASKDQFSGWVHALILMPAVRNANAMAHYYLDLIEGRGYKISIQLTLDKGSEVNEMVKIHEALRSESAPEFTLPNWPATKKEQSTNNTPIESFWRWQRDGEGLSIKHVLQEGSNSGVFSPIDEIHVQTFYWVWVPLIQERLDTYREYWNNHRVTASKNKINPHGKSPMHMFMAPQSVRATARDCSIKVNPETVHHFRQAYGGEEARNSAFEFVTKVFQAEADGVYMGLGRPDISLTTGWQVFTEVVKGLEALLHYS